MEIVCTSCSKKIADLKPAAPFNATFHCPLCGTDFGFSWHVPEPTKDAPLPEGRLEMRVPGLAMDRVPEDWMPNSGKPWFGPAQ